MLLLDEHRRRFGMIRCRCLCTCFLCQLALLNLDVLGKSTSGLRTRQWEGGNQMGSSGVKWDQVRNQAGSSGSHAWLESAILCRWLARYTVTCLWLYYCMCVHVWVRVCVCVCVCVCSRPIYVISVKSFTSGRGISARGLCEHVCLYLHQRRLWSVRFSNVYFTCLTRAFEASLPAMPNRYTCFTNLAHYQQSAWYKPVNVTTQPLQITPNIQILRN